jgi:transposase
MRHQSATTGARADGCRRLAVITGVDRRRRWTEEEKARIVAESLDPATTVSTVARRYGLHASQLSVWRQQLQRRVASPAASGGPALVPVLLAEDSAAPAAAAGRMEIALGAGWGGRLWGVSTVKQPIARTSWTPALILV